MRETMDEQTHELVQADRPRTGSIAKIREWERANGVALHDRIPSRAERRRFERLARLRGAK